MKKTKATKTTSGIYKLYFNNCDKVYIGKSVHIERRFKEHQNSNEKIQTFLRSKQGRKYKMSDLKIKVVEKVPIKFDYDEARKAYTYAVKMVNKKTQDQKQDMRVINHIITKRHKIFDKKYLQQIDFDNWNQKLIKKYINYSNLLSAREYHYITEVYPHCEGLTGFNKTEQVILQKYLRKRKWNHFFLRK